MPDDAAVLRDLAVDPVGLGFACQINPWLWFTVLFANFAEAVAEGGKAQAATLRRSKTETMAKLLSDGGKTRVRYRAPR